jgi:hypothetical protein
MFQGIIDLQRMPEKRTEEEMLGKGFEFQNAWNLMLHRKRLQDGRRAKPKI